MDVARDAAPEIDRLVLSVNQGLGPTYGGQLMVLARERGLESLELLPHFADFLLAGTLSRQLATLRMRYWPSERVLGRLDELAGKHLIQQRGSGLMATPVMGELLKAMLAARASVAADAWGEHDGDVATATGLARAISLRASADHAIAVVHRAPPEPTDRYLRLHHHLMTLRYICQHDHAEAWRSRGLVAAAMEVMTQLWHGDPVDARHQGLAELVRLGFADADALALTAAGREARNTIEAETNERAQATFGALDPQASGAFVNALRNLPSIIA